MPGWRGLVAAAGGAMLLAGCAGGEMWKTESIHLTGGDFRASLFKEYRDLARTEYGEGDYGNSDRFALRAQAVAAGARVEPERPSAQSIPADKLDEMMAARRRLVALVAHADSRGDAAQIARAQAMFDCWVEEQEENRQPDHIALCRGEFLDAAGRAEASLAPPPRPVAQPLAKPVLAAMTRPALAAAAKPRAFVVYFDFDKAVLDDAAKATLAEAVAEAQRLGGARLVIGGHADLVGTEKYNLSLSERRAAAAARFMQGAGLKRDAIDAKGFGESQPVKATIEREPANRRVEIRLETR